MKLIIFGGTGFIGKALIASPLMQKYDLFVISRSPERIPPGAFPGVHFVKYDIDPSSELVKLLSGEYAIINLTGENIAGGLWTKARRQKIIQSRTFITKEISNLVNKANQKPLVFLQGSATGFYGSQGDKKIDESSPKGSGFLADVTEVWENSLNIADKTKTRIVFIRTGLVLGEKGGLLSRLKLPFLFFIGGHLGNGKQWMPWIHIDDEIAALKFLIENKMAKGKFNLCSPEPVTMKTFCKSLGKSLQRPSWFHVPAWLLKLLLGSFAEELLLTSQYIFPKNLEEAGYKFKYKTIQDALDSIVK
ncbi:MAG: TIGR01777 family oxidoreductase [Bacteroidales bacterium]